MNENLFRIILALIPVLGTALTLVVVPYFEEKIGNEKLAKYKEWASLAVKCAEMIFVEQGMGESKKQYVIDVLNNMFNKNRTVITPEQIEILIESAVKEMKLIENK